MNRIVILLTLIVMSDLFNQIAGQNDVSCYDLSQCINKLKILTNEENMAFAHEEEHLEELCGKLKDAVDCVNTFILRCLDWSSQIQYQAMTNGTQKLIKDLCTKGSPFRLEYQKHAKCFHKNQQYYLGCSERYFSSVDQSYKDEDPTTQVKIWCCNFDRHRMCTYDAVLENCGNDAATLAQQIVLTGGGVMVEMYCPNYTLSSPLCSSGLTHYSTTNSQHISILMIILTLIFILNTLT